MTPLESLVACGTKLWLDSVDPDRGRSQLGPRAPTGATSNPIIIADLHQDRPVRRARSTRFMQGRPRTTTTSPGR